MNRSEVNKYCLSATRLKATEIYNFCHTIRMHFTCSEIKKMSEDSSDSSVYSRGSIFYHFFASENYQSNVCSRHGNKTSFLEDLLDTRTANHKPYRSLSLWERVKRKQRVAKEMLTACIIDAEQLNEDQNGYSHGNKILVVDCLNFIDQVKKTDWKRASHQIRWPFQ